MLSHSSVVDMDSKDGRMEGESECLVADRSSRQQPRVVKGLLLEMMMIEWSVRVEEAGGKLLASAISGDRALELETGTG
jgi:hypothetical protein